MFSLPHCIVDNRWMTLWRRYIYPLSDMHMLVTFSAKKINYFFSSLSSRAITGTDRSRAVLGFKVRIPPEAWNSLAFPSPSFLLIKLCGGNLLSWPRTYLFPLRLTRRFLISAFFHIIFNQSERSI